MGVVDKLLIGHMWKMTELGLMNEFVLYGENDNRVVKKFGILWTSAFKTMGCIHFRIACSYLRSTRAFRMLKNGVWEHEMNGGTWILYSVSKRHIFLENIYYMACDIIWTPFLFLARELDIGVLVLLGKDVNICIFFCTFSLRHIIILAINKFFKCCGQAFKVLGVKKSCYIAYLNTVLKFKPIPSKLREMTHKWTGILTVVLFKCFWFCWWL